MHIALTLPNMTLAGQPERQTTAVWDSAFFGADALNTSFSLTNEVPQFSSSLAAAGKGAVDINTAAFGPALRELAELAAVEKLNQEFAHLTFSVSDFARSAPGADMAPLTPKLQADNSLDLANQLVSIARDGSIVEDRVSLAA